MACRADRQRERNRPCAWFGATGWPSDEIDSHAGILPFACATLNGSERPSESHKMGRPFPRYAWLTPAGQNPKCGNGRIADDPPATSSMGAWPFRHRSFNPACYAGCKQFPGLRAVNHQRVLLVSDAEVEKATEERAMVCFAAIFRQRVPHRPISSSPPIGQPSARAIFRRAAHRSRTREILPQTFLSFPFCAGSPYWS